MFHQILVQIVFVLRSSLEVAYIAQYADCRSVGDGVRNWVLLPHIERSKSCCHQARCVLTKDFAEHDMDDMIVGDMGVAGTDNRDSGMDGIHLGPNREKSIRGRAHHDMREQKWVRREHTNHVIGVFGLPDAYM